MREINAAIIEGTECKLLLQEKNRIIRVKDTALENMRRINTARVAQIKLVRQSDSLSTSRLNQKRVELAECNQIREEAQNDVKRLRKARNRYAWLSGLEAVAIAAIIYLSVK